jgi:uncharacterized protein
MDRLVFETKLAIADSGEITGTAWPFGTPDRIGDVIEKGAFAGTSLPLPMLFGHDLNDPIGTWTEASEETDGLKVKGALLVAELPRAREVNALVKSGAVRGLSVGFRTKKATTRKGGGRTISQLELMEISLVTIPMHPGAKVTSAKSAVSAIRLAEAINRAVAHMKG